MIEVTSVLEATPGKAKLDLASLRVIADDVKPMNFGVHCAWRKANDRK